MGHWKHRRHGRRHGGNPFGFGGRHGDREAMEALLAEELNVTPDELRAAQERAFARSIERAVAEGELAPKHAERMLAFMKLRSYVSWQDLAAEVLGMTPEELEAAGDEGKTVWDLLAEQDMDPSTAWQRLMEAGKAKLQQAVADGVITQEQADELWQRRGFGPKGFFGHHRRGLGGFPRRGGWGPWMGHGHHRNEPPSPPIA